MPEYTNVESDYNIHILNKIHESSNSEGSSSIINPKHKRNHPRACSCRCTYFLMQKAEPLIGTSVPIALRTRGRLSVFTLTLNAIIWLHCVHEFKLTWRGRHDDVS